MAGCHFGGVGFFRLAANLACAWPIRGAVPTNQARLYSNVLPKLLWSPPLAGDLIAHDSFNCIFADINHEYSIYSLCHLCKSQVLILDDKIVDHTSYFWINHNYLAFLWCYIYNVTHRR